MLFADIDEIIDGTPEEKIMTNADIIRAMSDDELAELLEGELGNMMPGTALEWLKQPAKIELQDVVDLDKQTRDNNAAMRKVMDFITEVK